MEIDLNNFKNPNSRVLSGRKEGLKVREKLNLDSIDKNEQKVTVIIPDDIISLNSSFFLGLFGPSVRLLNEFSFKNKYEFLCPDFIQSSIEDGIERALKTSNPLDYKK